MFLYFSSQVQSLLAKPTYPLYDKKFSSGISCPFITDTGKNVALPIFFSFNSLMANFACSCVSTTMFCIYEARAVSIATEYSFGDFISLETAPQTPSSSPFCPAFTINFTLPANPSKLFSKLSSKLAFLICPS